LLPVDSTDSSLARCVVCTAGYQYLLMYDTVDIHKYSLSVIPDKFHFAGCSNSAQWLASGIWSHMFLFIILHIPVPRHTKPPVQLVLVSTDTGYGLDGRSSLSGWGKRIFSSLHPGGSETHWTGGLFFITKTFTTIWCRDPSIFTELKKKQKLHGLSPRANYTDRATAACRRSDCQLVRIKSAT
jgi:hypothetical protein